MSNIKTVGELKNYLTDLIAQLGESFEDNEEIEIVNNTYWLENQDNFICVPSVGFIDLKNPTNTERCEWCNARFDKVEMIRRGGWCLCEECFNYLATCGEFDEE